MKKKHPRVGIALDSGGARGGAHIGVLDVLIENNIPVDVIVGSSAGAFTGAIYATGKSARIKEIIKDLSWHESLSYYVDPVFPTSGLLAGKRARSFIQELVGNILVEELPIRFAAMATDLLSGESVVLDSGPLVDAVMASVSMPGIFKPVLHMNRLLTDGGVTNPLPVDALKRFDPDITIAVNLHSKAHSMNASSSKQLIEKAKPEPEDDTDEENLPAWALDRIVKTVQAQRIFDGVKPLANSILKKLGGDTKALELATHLDALLTSSREKITSLIEKSAYQAEDPYSLNIFEIMIAATNIQQYQKNRLMLAQDPPDIIITPEVSNIASLEFVRLGEAIEEGRQKALDALPAIQDLLASK